jgi:hypothetical protein
MVIDRTNEITEYSLIFDLVPTKSPLRKLTYEITTISINRVMNLITFANSGAGGNHSYSPLIMLGDVV